MGFHYSMYSTNVKVSRYFMINELIHISFFRKIYCILLSFLTQLHRRKLKNPLIPIWKVSTTSLCIWHVSDNLTLWYRITRFHSRLELKIQIRIQLWPFKVHMYSTIFKKKIVHENMKKPSSKAAHLINTWQMSW